jgi:GST-like protein
MFPAIDMVKWLDHIASSPAGNCVAWLGMTSWRIEHQPGGNPMLEVWSWPTPNGHKVHIALEELGLEYKIIPINIGAGDQFKPEFLAITPNHRIPAIVDPDGPGGKPFTLFESAAIMIYLSDKAGGKLIPKDPIGHYKCLEWIMFQMGGVGPMFGQWNHFGAYAPEKIPYAIERYTNEVKRLSRVLNHRLEETRWLAGDEYSMADIITFPWIRTATQQSSRFDERGYVDLGDYPAVKRWHDEIEARPAVQRGLKVLADAQRPGKITDAEREITFGKTQFAVR